MTFDLSGRTALVTGASSGLGKGFAKAIARAGARTVLAARRRERVEALAEEIRGTGGAALGIEMDVSDQGSVIDAFDEVEARWGGVDTIVCNAGVGVGGRSTEMPVEDLRTVVDTNLLGVYLTAREGAKRLIAAGSRQRQHGRIVVIGSITAMQHHTGDAAYAATKIAVAHLVRNFAKEWVRQGINLNTLQPGWVHTEINDDWFQSQQGQRDIAQLPRRRLLDETSLHDMLLYLCSDRSAQVTGATITVDDGQSL